MSEKKFGGFDGEMLIGKAKEKDPQKEAKELAESLIPIEEGKTKKICGWCGGDMGEKAEEVKYGKTHSICYECKQKSREQKETLGYLGEKRDTEEENKD